MIHRPYKSTLQSITTYRFEGSLTVENTNAARAANHYERSHSHRTFSAECSCSHYIPNSFARKQRGSVEGTTDGSKRNKSDSAVNERRKYGPKFLYGARYTGGSRNSRD